MECNHWSLNLPTAAYPCPTPSAHTEPTSQGHCQTTRDEIHATAGLMITTENYLDIILLQNYCTIQCTLGYDRKIGEFVQTLDNTDRILSSVWLQEHMMTSSQWCHHHYGVIITMVSSSLRCHHHYVIIITAVSSWTLAGCYHTCTVNSCLQMATSLRH